VCVFEGIVRIYVGFFVDINIKILGVTPPPPPHKRLGMPFLDSGTCVEGGLFIFARVFFPCMMPSMNR